MKKSFKGAYLFCSLTALMLLCSCNNTNPAANETESAEQNVVESTDTLDAQKDDVPVYDNAQLLTDYLYGKWQCAGSDEVMEINDSSFYCPWFGVSDVSVNGSMVEFDCMSNGFSYRYMIDTAAPDKLQLCICASTDDPENWG